ncbi:hypothetical protein TNCV_2930651 [Trichonephila clavipes]|nr:hypothetical protein TNCV_2930651 [Trichonephila clavipes]
MESLILCNLPRPVGVANFRIKTGLYLMVYMDRFGLVQWFLSFQSLGSPFMYQPDIVVLQDFEHSSLTPNTYHLDIMEPQDFEYPSLTPNKYQLDIMDPQDFEYPSLTLPTHG